MKLTNYAIHKISKTVLLIIFGSILLLYLSPVLSEFQEAFESMIGSPLPQLFQLISIISYVVAFFCFINAALVVLAVIRADKFTIDDLAAKLDVMDRKLASAVSTPAPAPFAPQPIVIEQADIGRESVSTARTQEPPAPSDVPPPP